MLQKPRLVSSTTTKVYTFLLQGKKISWILVLVWSILIRYLWFGEQACAHCAVITADARACVRGSYLTKKWRKKEAAAEAEAVTPTTSINRGQACLLTQRIWRSSNAPCNTWSGSLGEEAIRLSSPPPFFVFFIILTSLGSSELHSLLFLSPFYFRTPGTFISPHIFEGRLTDWLRLATSRRWFENNPDICMYKSSCFVDLLGWLEIYIYFYDDDHGGLHSCHHPGCKILRLETLVMKEFLSLPARTFWAKSWIFFVVSPVCS